MVRPALVATSACVHGPTVRATSTPRPCRCRYCSMVCRRSRSCQPPCNSTGTWTRSSAPLSCRSAAAWRRVPVYIRKAQPTQVDSSTAPPLVHRVAEVVRADLDDRGDQLRRRVDQQRPLREAQVGAAEGGEPAVEPRLFPQPDHRVGRVLDLPPHRVEGPARAERVPHADLDHPVPTGGEQPADGPSEAIGPTGTWLRNVRFCCLMRRFLASLAAAQPVLAPGVHRVSNWGRRPWAEQPYEPEPSAGSSAAS